MGGESRRLCCPYGLYRERFVPRHHPVQHQPRSLCCQLKRICVWPRVVLVISHPSSDGRFLEQRIDSFVLYLAQQHEECRTGVPINWM